MTSMTILDSLGAVGQVPRPHSQHDEWHLNRLDTKLSQMAKPQQNVGGMIPLMSLGK